MKIVKRDGRTVDYNSDKIRIAIGKANQAVGENDRITNKGIEDIIKYIESLDKKRMLVEDIQDIIEEKLMEKKKFRLAKVYIIYRYKRSVIRKSNTIDVSILTIMKNGQYSEENYLTANRQRDVMAGEVSKDLAYRLLLPQNIVEAEQEGRIKFCNVEYFTEPIIESAKINVKDMFENGTVINKIKIDPPKSFQAACNILVEIISSVASSQTGNIYIDFEDLFDYYDFSFDKIYDLYSTLLRDALDEDQIKAIAHTQVMKEVQTGIQTLFYQINTLTIGSGMVPKVNFLIDVRKIKKYEQERLIFEFIKQKTEGIKDEDGQIVIPTYPQIVYCLPEGEDLIAKYSYITSELTNSRVYYIMTEKRYDSFCQQISRFNQGSVAINLAALAMEIVDKGNGDFAESVKANLEFCYEALLCRNHNLQGVYSDKSPIHWQHGAITRLAKMKRIDDFLKKEHSFMVLHVCGFEAAMQILGNDVKTKKEIRDLIVDMVKSWNRDSSFETVLSNECVNFLHDDVDKYEKFGITSLSDSIDFMKDSYFKDGFIYASCENIEEALLEGNLIIRFGKRESK